MYKDTWMSIFFEELSTVTDPENLHDKHVIERVKDNRVNGHMPRNHLKTARR